MEEQEKPWQPSKWDKIICKWERAKNDFEVHFGGWRTVGTLVTMYAVTAFIVVVAAWGFKREPILSKMARTPAQQVSSTVCKNPPDELRKACVSWSGAKERHKSVSRELSRRIKQKEIQRRGKLGKLFL